MDNDGQLSGEARYENFRKSTNVEDRRAEENPMAAKWSNVLPAIKNIVNNLKSQYIGEPIPEEVMVTELSKQLGHNDIHIVPNVGQSPLQSLLDDMAAAGHVAKGMAKAIRNEVFGEEVKTYNGKLDRK